jgi:two-component system NtrC family sensor kinase
MKRLQLQPSLRSKIILGYYAVAALIVGVSIFTFEQLRLVEEKILVGEKISELFDTTLEIRRFERNYFLHAEMADYQEAVNYMRKMDALLNQDFGRFAALAEPERIGALRRDLAQYADLMRQYVTANQPAGTRDAQLEERIRVVGKQIVGIAEDMANTERRLVRTSVASFRKVLVFSIIGGALLLIAFGQALSRRVVQPLRQMEASVNAISSADGDKLTPPSRDREIVSIINAFNHMLRELELRQKHLLRSEKLASLGTMLSGVAHELNNPLSNIWSSCQILEEELEDGNVAQQRELLARMDEQCVRARNIVRALLDFARDKPFKKEALNLSALLQQTLGFIKGQIPAQVTLALDVPADITVFADKQRLQQAFLNLIENALQAVGASGQVAIAARRRILDGQEHDLPVGCRAEGEVVEIVVRDNGAGIPPEVLPRVFDPFFTTKDVGKGMGLGLFIVYEIVDEHDGCIAVGSVPGQGSVFTITLPLARGATQQELN